MDLTILRNFVYVVTFRTMALTGLSVLATYLCIKYDLIADMPTALIGLAVVFPLVFTISASFERRDKALIQYGSLNASLAMIFYAHKSWLSAANVDVPLRNQKVRDIIEELLALIKQDLTNIQSPASYKTEIYKSFSSLSDYNDEFLARGMTDSHAILASCLYDAIKSYECLSTISDYRTPKALRAYSRVFLNLFPILFAPYFASLSMELFFMGYLIAILYSLVLVMLNNIQDNVENPFDNQGLDDIDLDLENRFIKSIE